MVNLDLIKNEIERLYKTAPEIHVSIKSTRPKVDVTDGKAVITGVYRSIFQIEEVDTGRTAKHTVQYGDVLIGRIVIRERGIDFGVKESK